MRGGSQRDRTFQWTEVLAQLRENEIDQGPWAVHGAPARVARVAGWFGKYIRTPRKEDFAYNFSFSGARCANLAGELGQVTQLEHLLKARPELWNTGAVVIRIGINDLGKRTFLDDVAANGVRDEVLLPVQGCVRQISDAVIRIREAHSSVRVVLVGIADNANWPPNFDAWNSSREMQNITALHDAYDDGLRRMANSSMNVSFFDERAWFRSLWGGRGSTGELAYRDLCIGEVVVKHSQGDAIENTIIADGHAGTALNALWARSLLQSILEATGARATPISLAEVGSYLARLQAGRSDSSARGACADGGRADGSSQHLDASAPCTWPCSGRAAIASRRVRARFRIARERESLSRSVRHL